MTRVKVARNYRITIPEQVRSKVNLKEGDTVDIEAIDSDRVLVKRVIQLDELEGAWKDDPGVDEAMKEVAKLWKIVKQEERRRKRHSA